MPTEPPTVMSSFSTAGMEATWGYNVIVPRRQKINKLTIYWEAIMLPQCTLEATNPLSISNKPPFDLQIKRQYHVL